MTPPRDLLTVETQPQIGMDKGFSWVLCNHDVELGVNTIFADNFAQLPLVGMKSLYTLT
jgi:hypothetical protein